MARQLRLGTAVRPSFNISSAADLEGSPWVVIADGKGVVSTWNAGPDADQDEPDHVLEAHVGPITQVIPLSSSRLPEVIEELEWPEELLPGVPRKMVAQTALAPRDDASVSTAASPPRLSPQGSRQLRRSPSDHTQSGRGSHVSSSRFSVSTEATGTTGATDASQPGLLRRLCCCCCKKKSKRRKRKQKFKRVERRHWLLATAGQDGALRIWRFRPTELPASAVGESDEEPEALEVDFVTEWISAAKIPVTRIEELHDGHIALALASSPDVRILDPITSHVKSVLFGHTGQLLCFAACADGRLVTGGADGSVRLWARRTWGKLEEEGDSRKAVEDLHPVNRRASDGSMPMEPLWDDLPGQVTELQAPPVAAIGWQEPGQEPACAGVSSTAFYAHMQQAQKGEAMNLSVRVYVVCAESLPKGGAADPYVHCCVLEGEQREPAAGATVRTFSKTEPVWNHRCCLPLRRSLVDGEWRMPECSRLDFELFFEPKSRKTCEILLGHWTSELDEVLEEIEQDPLRAAIPRARKLFAPSGEGPYQELHASVLHLGFEQASSESLDCTVSHAEGLPENMAGTLYVRAHVRQALEGKARRLPPPRCRERTRVVRKSANPFFDEVLELEVPVHLTDRQLIYGPELSLHVEVYDSAAVATEDLMATLTLPLATVLQVDGMDPRPYNLVLAPSVLPKKKKKGGLGRSAELVGLRKAAAVEEEVGEDGLGDLLPLSQLHLGFQAIMPCPVQLRCTVEYAQGVPTMLPTSPSAPAPVSRGTFSPLVRMTFVEGNPLPSHVTAARTRTWRQPLRPADQQASPVWNETLYLTLPDWIWAVSLSKEPPDPQRLSVREGWEHRHKDDPQEAVVCVDVYDCDALGCDKFLGRAIVPFSHAYAAARAGTGQQPRPVNLTCLPDSMLFLGFEMSANDDRFGVIVAGADDLPVDGTSKKEAAMSCIVRVAELGAFYAPTDKADLTCVARAQTPVGQGHPRDPVWQHEEVLELPGGEVDSVVAVRPNWYLLFQILDSDPRASDAPPLAVAAAPLCDVLSQSCEAQAPEKTSAVLQKRIEKSRAPIMPAKSKIAAPPGAEISATVPIVRELPLVIRTASLALREKAQPDSPGGGLRDRVKAGTKMLTKTVTKSLTKMLTRKVDLDALPETSPQALSLEDGVHDEDRVLVVRFEVLSRWKGTGGGAKCPPTRPMLGPSPVTSLVALISSVVAGHENGNVFIWDVTGSSAMPLHQFQAHKVPISSMVYLPALDCIITTAMAGKRKEELSESLLRVWSCSTLELRQTEPLHGAGTCVLFPVNPESKGSGSVLALGKDARQSSILQFFKLDGT